MARARGSSPRDRTCLTGGGGNDLLDGGLGPDVSTAGDGHRRRLLRGPRGWHRCFARRRGQRRLGARPQPANNATDEISRHVENLIGGSGNDVLKGDGGENTFLGGPGDDKIQGHGGSDDARGRRGQRRARGRRPGRRHATAAPATTALTAAAETTCIDGGDGSDTADFSDATTPVSVTPGDGAGRREAGRRTRRWSNVEGAIGGLDDDRLFGNDGPGTFIGNGGNDLFNGGLGADTLHRRRRAWTPSATRSPGPGEREHRGGRR